MDKPKQQDAVSFNIIGSTEPEDNADEAEVIKGEWSSLPEPEECMFDLVGLDALKERQSEGFFQNY